MALLAPPALGQPATAAQLERQGHAAADRRDYDAAIAAFTGAYAAEPKPVFRCNIGSAYYGKQDFHRAQLYISWCLDRITAAPEQIARVADFVERKLREAGMVKVRITTAPTGAAVALDGLDTLASPVAVFLPVGKHAIEISHEGHEPATETFELIEKQDRTVAVTLEAIASEPDPPVSGPRVADPPARDPPARDPPARDPPARDPIVDQPVELEVESRWRRVPAYVAGGVAVASLAAGVGFYLHARDIASGLATVPAGATYERGKDRAQRNHHIAISGWAIAGAAAAVGAYLFARPEKTRRGLSAGARPTRGGAIVGVSVDL